MQPFTASRRALLPLLARLAPRRDATRPIPFVLLSTQRTGSSWLLDQLHAHPRIFMHSELFLNDGEGLPRFAGDGKLVFFNTHVAQTGAGSGWNTKRRVLRDYLDLAFEARDGIGAVGFKLMYSQLRRVPEVLSHLVWRRARILHLTRGNLLDVYLSRHAREVRGFAHATDREPVEDVKLEIDCAHLLKHLRRSAREHDTFRRQIDRIGLVRHEIVYERMVADPSSLEEAARFLGQEPAPHASPQTFRKLTQSSHREQIVNHHEVAAALRGTPFEAMLDDS